MIETMLILIGCYLASQYIACLFAQIESHYYDTAPTDTRGHKNLHPFLTWFRIFVHLPLGAIVWYWTYPEGYYNWSYALCFTVACVFAFPFWHDGIYSIKRNRLNPDIYKDGFTADKQDPNDNHSADMDIPWKWRLPMFLFSIILIIGLIISL